MALHLDWKTPEPLMAAGLVGAIGFAGMLGGWGWAGLVGALSLALVSLASQQQAVVRRLAEHEAVQRVLSHAEAPEALAGLRMEGELANQELFSFLSAIKTATGGESFTSGLRESSPDQLEPLRPGVAFSLGHDNGWWYAKLVLSGEAGKRFMNGEYPQWRARGRTAEEAVSQLLRQCGKARQQVVLKDYVARVVAEQE